jgi:rhodanese-related sulfurtransferase
MTGIFVYRWCPGAELLRSAGFARVWHLVGGIDRWSDEVDASVPKY